MFFIKFLLIYVLLPLNRCKMSIKQLKSLPNNNLVYKIEFKNYDKSYDIKIS